VNALRALDSPGFDEPERVAWTANADDGTDWQLVVNLVRSAATIRNPAYRDPVAASIGGIAAQRVLTYPSRGQVQVEVCPGIPPFEVAAVRCSQFETDHIVVGGHRRALRHRERCLVLVDPVFRWLVAMNQDRHLYLRGDQDIQNAQNRVAALAAA